MPSLSVCLFGTEEKVEPHIQLKAGPLSAQLHMGSIRYLRFDSHEVLRAVSFVVRDKDWGTYIPELSDFSVKESRGSFSVSYKATVKDNVQLFSYSVEITGDSDGTLVFSAEGKSQGDFLTSRAGFVVLHPVIGISGSPVEITHINGRKESGAFPDLIDPVQPMMDLRAITHTSPGSLEVMCLMEGDTFEMEDQRNWSDASYKTYSRPLALPWPYTLKSGETIQQKVTVTIKGTPAKVGKKSHKTITAGENIGTVPPLGQGLQPEDSDELVKNINAARGMNLSYLILYHDIQKGHNRRSLQIQINAARMLGVDLWLEAVIASVDGFASELDELARMIRSLDVHFSTILVSPAADLKSTLPGSPWPPAPDAKALYDYARSVFPNTRIGGGVFCYFAELNRKRPVIEALDMVTFTTSSLIHAGDDLSVMESGECYSSIIKSVNSICGDTPWVVGPSAMGMRHNPYGETPRYNPTNIRQAMNWNDPRQRGLLGAVWNLGYFASFSRGGAQGIALGAPVGAFGAVSSHQDFPQPYYDEHKGLFPVFHILRGLSALCGNAVMKLNLSETDDLVGIAVQVKDQIEIWLGNTQAERRIVNISTGRPKEKIRGAVLDAKSFTAAVDRIDFMDRLKYINAEEICIESYGVMRLIIPG